VYDDFERWDWGGTLVRIHHELYVRCREQAGREASPTAGIIDSQSVKGADNGGHRSMPAGYDAGKKVKGKKRHILVDTQGFLMNGSGCSSENVSSPTVCAQTMTTSSTPVAKPGTP
jgi:putative transposase